MIAACELSWGLGNLETRARVDGAGGLSGPRGLWRGVGLR